MKKHLFLASAILSASFFIAGEGRAQNDPIPGEAANITSATAVTAAQSETTDQNPRLAAQSFIEHVSYARVALAMKNGDLAQQHLSQAQDMLSILKTSAEEQHRVKDVKTNWVVYHDGPTKAPYHYFPVETGAMNVETVDSGPFWAKNEGLSVVDADVAYVLLDLRGDRAEKYLADAVTEINQKNFDEADKNLAELTDSSVKMEDRVSLPPEKALDNIALARSFVIMSNYDGAHYALNHADAALNAMERDDRYKANQPQIQGMRDEVKAMQQQVKNHDPTLLQKASMKMKKWQVSLEQWIDPKTE